MKIVKLTCEKARKINLIEILKNIGFSPTKETSNDAWFLSPFRKESKASFKVSKKINRWYDHGLGKGGNAIDLIMQIYNYSVKEALNYLSGSIDSFSFHKQSNNLTKNENYTITKIRNLNNQALLNYLQSRKINIDIAKKYCNEIYYKMNKKNYFAIAFKNISDGFEIRNKYFKGCLKNKDFSLVKNEGDTVLIFEGFFDFLSYLSLKFKGDKKTDFIILNSIHLIENVSDLLKKYNSIFSFLDNDVPGKKGLEFLKNNHENVIDMSFMYEDYNDLNECLMNRKESLTIENISVQIG